MTIFRSRMATPLLHACGAPGCTRRIKPHYFACNQHRGLLDFELNVRLQAAWLERRYRPAHFVDMKAWAFKAWGWQPESTSGAAASCQT
jgi:hypothetical protein